MTSANFHRWLQISDFYVLIPVVILSFSALLTIMNVGFSLISLITPPNYSPNIHFCCSLDEGVRSHWCVQYILLFSEPCHLELCTKRFTYFFRLECYLHVVLGITNHPKAGMSHFLQSLQPPVKWFGRPSPQHQTPLSLRASPYTWQNSLWKYFSIQGSPVHNRNTDTS